MKMPRRGRGSPAAAFRNLEDPGEEAPCCSEGRGKSEAGSEALKLWEPAGAKRSEGRLQTTAARTPCTTAHTGPDVTAPQEPQAHQGSRDSPSPSKATLLSSPAGWVGMAPSNAFFKKLIIF
ncbi:hypothetical protein HJG60_010554 [Phyllostomus discolor]|uniref:Uncharacterized protein n=1 Tax=Phyllostomus discolor TaxID=89673 RepID=A0A834EF00_9CHIR|nr:hypothetical protein HJG60_010554 [Phyllostomus discolor]